MKSNNFNNFMLKIVPFLLISVIITNLMVFNSIKNIPSTKLFKSDTTIVKKIVTPTLKNLNKFVYLEAEILEDGRQIEDNYGFDPDVPNEIQKGYISLVESNDGGKYYIWSKVKILKNNIKNINGWFMTMNGKYQYKHEKEYYNVLIPIIEKKKVDLNN